MRGEAEVEPVPRIIIYRGEREGVSGLGLWRGSA